MFMQAKVKTMFTGWFDNI